MKKCNNMKENRSIFFIFSVFFIFSLFHCFFQSVLLNQALVISGQKLCSE